MNWGCCHCGVQPGAGTVGDRRGVGSGVTAAARYGLHLTVTHKPFRAATAPPQLEARPRGFSLVIPANLHCVLTDGQAVIQLPNDEQQNLMLFFHPQGGSPSETQKEKGEVWINTSLEGKHQKYSHQISVWSQSKQPLMLGLSSVSESGWRRMRSGLPRRIITSCRKALSWLNTSFF